jgi:hypothetical protein
MAGKKNKKERQEGFTVNLNSLSALAYIAGKFDVTIQAVRRAAMLADTNDRTAIYLTLRNSQNNW